MDKEVKKEMRIRRQLLDIYNRSREQFATKEEWDDYIELIEDYVFQLMENESDREVWRKIEEYQAQHADEIAHNKARKVEQQRHAAAEAGAAGGAGAVAEDMPPSTAVKLQHSSLESQELLGKAQADWQAAEAAADLPPMPVGAAVMDAEGTLQASGPLSRERVLKAAQASGWSEEFTRQRFIHEAFSSLFVC